MAFGKDWIQVAGPGLLDPNGLYAAPGLSRVEERGRVWVFTTPPLMNGSGYL